MSAALTKAAIEEGTPPEASANDCCLRVQSIPRHIIDLAAFRCPLCGTVWERTFPNMDDIVWVKKPAPGRIELQPLSEYVV